MRTPLDTTAMLAVALVLFDQHEWAEEWFLTKRTSDVLLPGLRALVHRVDLQCGFDES